MIPTRASILVPTKTGKLKLRTLLLTAEQIQEAERAERVYRKSKRELMAKLRGTQIIEGPFAGFERNFYGTVYADPAWRFETYDQAVAVTARGQTVHYGTREALQGETIRAAYARYQQRHNCEKDAAWLKMFGRGEG
jgi:hypothetical protein